MSLPLIYDLDLQELTALLAEWDEPAYRARQIWEAIYSQLKSNPDDFSTLPLALRARLEENIRFQGLTTQAIVDSADKSTRKILFQLGSGDAVETVLMRYPKRRTFCISTQSGCALGCVFCATGQMGFRANLSSGEIVEQVLFFARALQEEGARPTNIVFMGMGEPFLNYEALMAAIDRLNHPDGFNFGARRFTISTVGLVPQIRRFAAERRQVNLAISLHAADDVLRSSMMPINNKYPLDTLLEACREYVELTSRRISFEWALIDGVNDSASQADLLAQRLAGIKCHVNVIPLNPTRGYDGAPTTENRASAFCRYLEDNGIPCSIRARRGIDIQAGCGQLAIETGGSEVNL